MGKTFTILWFHISKTNSNGWYQVHCGIRRGKKVYNYIAGCRDFESWDELNSPVYEEKMYCVYETVMYILNAHRIKCSKLVFSHSVFYSYKKYSPRMRQTCRLARFCKSDILWLCCDEIPCNNNPYFIDR